MFLSGSLRITLLGRGYSLTLGRVPATSEFFTRVLACPRDPLLSCTKPGPTSAPGYAGIPLIRSSHCWCVCTQPLCSTCCQVKPTGYNCGSCVPPKPTAVPGAWLTLHTHVQHGPDPASQLILWASAAPCCLSPNFLSRLMQIM